MRKIYLILIGVLLTASIHAQAPQKMSYQAIIRNSSDVLITSTTVGMKISILQGSSSGTIVYSETHSANTNSNGLVSLEIGTGAPLTGTFANIDWATGPFFIKTETDPTGATNYSITGTSQLMSVPYALFSANSNVGGFSHYLGEPFNGGIIFYLYKGNDGKEHGLIVSLTESSLLQWQDSRSIVNANRTEDGAYNTGLMFNSPVKNYILGLGSGWYLPSIDELSLLYYNRFTVQKALRSGGNTLLSKDSNYWSSTEFDSLQAFNLIFSRGYGVISDKYSTFLARGIKSF